MADVGCCGHLTSTLYVVGLIVPIAALLSGRKSAGSTRKRHLVWVWEKMKVVSKKSGLLLSVCWYMCMIGL